MKTRFLLMGLALVALGTVLGSDREEKAMFAVSSPAFADGESIPTKHAYKGEGENVPPPLSWTGAPAGTAEIALICDDPDAPRPTPWVHWVVYGIPAAARSLPASAAREGRNDFGESGWGGPMPPKGHGVHHYHFKLYALREPVTLEDGATKENLLAAMKDKILAQAEIVGTYERK